MKTILNYTETRFFSNLIKAYLEGKEELKVLYDVAPDIKNFKKKIQSRKRQHCNRALLVNRIKSQYAAMNISDAVSANISALENKNTFTITTGHQLNVFTGPLYFIYKIITTINLSLQLKEEYPEYNFVPIYWMATEDHDFDEINHFTVNNKRMEWSRNSGGAVGKMDLDGLEIIYQNLSKVLGQSQNVTDLKKLFKKSYLEHANLSEATRFLVNSLFETQGLVIIDADDAHLKKEFIPYLQQDLHEQLGYKEVSKTNKYLREKGYKIQVNPREINLFYLQNNSRERIIKENDQYGITNSSLKFTKETLNKELQNHPENFSPNVLLRPLYQEVVLPNLAYIGGGGEIAYWLQLQRFFKKSKVSFPVLVVRNSVLWVHESQQKKIAKLGISVADLFLEPQVVIKKFIRQSTHHKIDFTTFEDRLRLLYKDIEQVAHCTDASFSAAARAQAQKQVNELYKLEKRLLKAQKNKNVDAINRLALLQESLFPNASLQERQQNFASFYSELGPEFFTILFKALIPFQNSFSILKYR